MTDRRAARRLLFLINDATFFVTHRLPLAAAAVKAGYDVHVALPFCAEALDNRRDLGAIRAAGATLHDLPMRRGGMHLLQEVMLMWRMWRLLARVMPDILHCITIKPVLYGGALARLMRISRVVFAIPGLGHIFVAQGLKVRIIRRLAMAVYGFVLNNARSVTIFQNEENRNLFLSAGIVAHRQTVLIPGVGVDTNEFYPAASPPPEPLVVLLPARLQQEKGVREFVAAARLLKSRGQVLRMVLAGYLETGRPGGISEAELRQWCGSGAIEWWGHRTAMPDTMREAHMVCLPSYGGEGFPKVLIEAGACGLPVVTTDVPGCRDAVLAGETAILVPPYDAVALADALQKLLDGPALRASMGERGRELVLREFSAGRFIAASLELYHPGPV